jgi:hypothetical protein
MSRTMVRCFMLGLVLVAALAATASANRIQISPGGEITLTSLGMVAFHTGLGDFKCHLTMTGRLVSEAVENASGTGIGQIGEFTTGESCEQFPGMLPLGLPWPIRLTTSYTGTRVELSIIGIAFNIEQVFSGLECLYSGNENGAIEVASGVSGLVTSAANAIPRAPGQSIFCPSEGKLIGRFTLEPRQTVSTI